MTMESLGAGCKACEASQFVGWQSQVLPSWKGGVNVTVHRMDLTERQTDRPGTWVLVHHFPWQKGCGKCDPVEDIDMREGSGSLWSDVIMSVIVGGQG